MSGAFWQAVLCAIVAAFCYRAGWIDGYWARAKEERERAALDAGGKP